MPRERPTKNAVQQRIQELFDTAQTLFSVSPTLSNQRVHTAKVLSMKYRTRIPASLKRRMCKHCDTFLMPGINCRVRTRSGKIGRIVYTCFSCKKYSRIGYNKRHSKK